MNNAKHTPGPWVILKGWDGTVEISASRPYRINNISAGTPLICDVYQHPAFDGFSSQANANLIASAPELLEALELISRYIEPTAVDAASMQKVARAAIAKATGAESSDAQPAQGAKL